MSQHLQLHDTNTKITIISYCAVPSSQGAGCSYKSHFLLVHIHVTCLFTCFLTDCTPLPFRLPKIATPNAFRSMSTKVKDTLPMEKQSKVVPDPLQLWQGLHLADGRDSDDSGAELTRIIDNIRRYTRGMQGIVGASVSEEERYQY